MSGRAYSPKFRTASGKVAVACCGEWVLEGKGTAAVQLANANCGASAVCVRRGKEGGSALVLSVLAAFASCLLVLSVE
jgi:hypothetical protein